MSTPHIKEQGEPIGLRSNRNLPLVRFDRTVVEIKDLQKEDFAGRAHDI